MTAKIYDFGKEKSDRLLPVPFRDVTLYVADKSDEPYVPMKPIVEGMGLDWSSQHKKLVDPSGRWVSRMVFIAIRGTDGKPRDTLCFPLRKLSGWLMSVDHRRVKPEIRDNILAYQGECDDILWEAWKSRGGLLDRETAEFLSIPQFEGHEEGSLVPLASQLRAALRVARCFGFYGIHARAAANQFIKERHHIDLGAMFGIDFDQACPEDYRQEQVERMFIGARNPVVNQFWEAYRKLEIESPKSVNHSKKPDIIAINMNQFVEVARDKGLEIPTLLELKQNLKESTDPRFVDRRTVSSIITGGKVNCWVFRSFNPD